MTEFVPDPLVIPNFLSERVCDVLIHAHTVSPQQTNLNKQKRPVVVPAGDVKTLTDHYVTQTTKLFENYFKIALVPQSTTLELWRTGLSMAPHIDDHIPAILSQVVYLNDDYEGGETFFTQLNLTVTPKRGTLVGFRCNCLKHEHGVNKILSGTRYTFTSWYKKGYTIAKSI